MRTKLKAEREAQGLNQKQLAECVGISRNHYCQIENGEKNPSLRVAVTIKGVLNYYGDDIFDNVNP